MTKSNLDRLRRLIESMEQDARQITDSNIQAVLIGNVEELKRIAHGEIEVSKFATSDLITMKTVAERLTNILGI